MLKRLGWLIGLSQRSRQTKTLDAHPYVATRVVKPVLMVDTVQEIAVYIHRFHNLDLFQQGWYQIKISMRWEDGDNNKSCGIPSRVVQYEALDSSSNDSSGVWKIDDKDNSFLTQPFRIKYARQDVRLCMMVSFTMPLQRYEGPATSAVILRFELLYSPIVENISLAHSDDSPASVHDFRIPPKALSGVHSYCPVHFDTFHAVLIDVSVHVSVMKSASYKRPAVLSSEASSGKSLSSGNSQSSKKAFAQIAPADKLVSFVKALLGARDTLLEEMQKLSKATDQTIDLSEFVSTMDKTLLSDSTEKTVDEGKQQNNLELHASLDLESDDWLHNFSKEHLSRTFHLLGTQLHYLWNTFLTFHRDNNTKILEYLRDTWTKDRRAEWSIWMVYSKVEMPHHFISGVDDVSNHSSHKRVTSALKLNDPAQVAATRAELHRRSIAQMRINNRAVQDMHIFGDPMRVPIVIIERVWNAPRRTFSENSYMRHVDKIDSDGFKNIILLSSPQDGYVPYHSARIQSCQPASFDNSKRGVAFLEMLNNCMDQIRGPSPETPHHQRVFMRCDVNFDTTLYGRNLNSFIGRAAHIEFLESDIFARFIMWSFQDLFR
ncbi:hypothetical protein DY000_02057980 [Brassica cretica]|uniref:Uncharacterized protein n=1 Tax=Brassica cretica TaxID=69181 RepID=A0ABQ7A5E0_BRACR|nr:hypothetical protein DY000_02057980 [Brassica cretica]